MGLLGRGVEPSHFVAQHKLVFHGIMNELSAWRIHVCPAARVIYRVETQQVRALLVPSFYMDFDRLHKGFRSVFYDLYAVNGLLVRYRLAVAMQVNIVTALGYLVPVKDAGFKKHLYKTELKQAWTDKYPYNDSLDEQAKGRWAETIVRVFCGLEPVNSLAEQRAGIDFFSKKGYPVEVKCDGPGGASEAGGTGNLFFQVYEANPFSKH